MPRFHRRSAAADVLAQPDAREVLESLAPEVLQSPLAASGGIFPIGGMLEIVLGGDEARAAEVLERLAEVEDLTERPAEAPPIPLREGYESESVERGSAGVSLPSHAAQNTLVEIVIDGPSHGNPFVDVDLRARFAKADAEISVGGFYDGDGRWVVRFLPAEAGEWTFITESNARSLDGIAGHVDVAPSSAKGAVHVVDDFHFAYADGSTYVPVGTTAYAWTHQPEELQEATLRSLAEAPFTKIRMGLFPKDFIYNANDPERFVFPRDSDCAWDTTRFDVEYFRHLEGRIAELDALGIQADLILFHPYDRWGFARLGRSADDRYISYVVRRLSAFPNVWWSLANEYDLLLDKSLEDWDRIGRLIRDTDPVGHPISIHNWLEIWDYSSEWATHASIQRGDSLNSQVRAWRRRWQKPVVVDELGYEGDLDQGWGFLTGEEELQRMWETTMGGGYATHGETFLVADDEIFWAKGGTLQGETPERLSFLRRILAESPTERFDPLPSDFDAVTAGVADDYLVTYFGRGRPRVRNVVVPEGVTAEIDIVDTWNMTIDTLPETHSGTVRVDLPGRPYVAIRVRKV